MARLAVVAAATLLLASPARGAGTEDPGFGYQWDLEAVGAPVAWLTGTGAGVRVAILDTGVDLQHVELAGRIVANTSCIGSGGRPTCGMGSGQDDNGHGSYVAGIVAAAKDNGQGIAGVAPDAQLLAVKVLDANGIGRVEDVAAGVIWAVDHGARIVNLSVGEQGGPLGEAEEGLAAAVDYAWSRGAVPVVSVSPKLSVSGALANANALVVGAIARNGAVASYSNPLTGMKWGLVAPGGQATDCSDSHQIPGCILSLSWGPNLPNLYAWQVGTSAAVPHVSGVAALLAAQGMTNAEIVARILGTLRPAACGSGCRGALDAAAAVGPPPPPPVVLGAVATRPEPPQPVAAAPATAAPTPAPATTLATTPPVTVDAKQEVAGPAALPSTPTAEVVPTRLVGHPGDGRPATNVTAGAATLVILAYGWEVKRRRPQAWR